MSEHDPDDHSRRTYNAAKRYILADHEDPMGPGLAKQLITETIRLPFKLLGIGLLVLSKALQRNSDQVDQAREVLKK